MVFIMYELLWADNGLGVEGARVIAKTLESNRSLTTLDLSCTDWLYMGDDSKERDD
jgi:hypothetical protein